LKNLALNPAVLNEPRAQTGAFEAKIEVSKKKERKNKIKEIKIIMEKWKY